MGPATGRAKGLLAVMKAVITLLAGLLAMLADDPVLVDITKVA